MLINDNDNDDDDDDDVLMHCQTRRHVHVSLHRTGPSAERFCRLRYVLRNSHLPLTYAMNV